MAVTITCIIPTIGRDTLYRSLASCEDADEIIVVVDQARAGDWEPQGLSRNVQVMRVPSCERGGHAGRNAAMPHATSTHLCFLDDDDIYLPGAIDTFRAAACDQPVIFRMDHYKHGILWRNQVLEFGNVSTQMVLVPNDPPRLGVWEEHIPGLQEPGGDYTFIRGCVEKMGGPVWRDEIVAKLRPSDLTVAIVTPWIDHRELAQDYIDAVSVMGPRDELIVVDNGSVPPLEFATIHNDINRGFSGASNQGLAEASADVVVFLNNDIAMRRQDWLAQLKAAVEPGVLVGRLRYDQHGHVDGQPMPYLDGWCLAGMRDDLLEIGGFDETLEEPAYYSDNLLCLEARAAGMTLRGVELGLSHKSGQTSQGSLDERVRTATLANRERYLDRARELLGAAVA